MGRAVCFVASVLTFTSTSVLAQTNSWINPASGNWQDATSWSLGVPPGSSQFVLITNAGFKAVAIQSSTASSFPQTLSVKSVTITSPSNSANTLLMNFVGAGHALVIGVNSNNPGSLIIGDTNSAMVMLSSGLIVNNVLGMNNSHVGEFEVAGTFTQSDTAEVVAGFLDVTSTGTYNLTNGQLFIGTQFINGRFNQQGGTNLGVVIFSDGGEYDLFDGLLKGGVGLDAPFAGVFNQSGGTNIGSLGLDGPGLYELSGGFLVPGDLQVGPSFLAPSSFGAGAVVQSGGTDNAGNITMGVGSYSLEGGVLTASNLALPTVSDRIGSFGSSFDQSGGFFSNGGVTMNGVVDNGLQPSTYTLSGGELATPTINMTLGLFNQSGGTNNVGVLMLGTSSSYNLTNGLLFATDIQVEGLSTFVHAGGSFGGLDNILLAGSSWVERTAGEQLGQLQLGAGTNSSSLNLPSGSCVLRFADSSGVPWATGGLLMIQNWSGSLNGGGSQQVFFGTSASGLTAQQLSQVQFINPAGLAPGTYSARILSDGEVVPIQGAAAGLVNSWINPASGNWQDATSWSLGIPPASNQSVMITNSGFKAVAIQPSTPINFPGSMMVSNLTITSPANSFNTLLMNFVGAGRPLVVGSSNTPGSLVIGPNSAMVMYSSGLFVNDAIGTNNSHLGGFEVGGTFAQSENSEVVANSFLDVTGTYNLTNGQLWGGGESISGTFNQQGGTNFGEVIFTVGGTYNLFAGVHNGSVELDQPFAGVFNQSGGTNIGSLGLDGPGLYQLSGGLLLPGNLQVGPSALSPSSLGAGAVVQTGGTDKAGNITMGVGSYTLEGGVLTASNLALPTVSDRIGSFGSSFDQSGGIFSNSSISMNGVIDPRNGLQPSTYTLSGGELATLTINMTLGLFNQSGGTNNVGVLTLVTNSSYHFTNGLLIATNIQVEGTVNLRARRWLVRGAR